MSKKAPPFARKCEIAVNGSEIVCNRFLIFGRYNLCFCHKIDFMGAVDDFNAIRALNLQFKMQKAGSMCGTGSFFCVVFNFSVRRIFPTTLSKHCFLLSNCWCYVFFLLSKSFSSFTFLSISEIIKSRITTNKHYYFLQY